MTDTTDKLHDLYIRTLERIAKRGSAGTLAQALADIDEAFAEADRIETEAQAQHDAEHAEFERAA